MYWQSGDYESERLSGCYEQDTARLREIFQKDAVLRVRELVVGEQKVRMALFYLDGMVDNDLITESVIRPLLLCRSDEADSVEAIQSRVLFASDVTAREWLSDMIRAVLYGDTLLILQGSRTALIVNTKGWRTRGISEPPDERVLSGPREGFDEAAMFNLAMIRRRLLTPDLCIETMRIGRRSETYVFLCYLASLADAAAVKELKKRLLKIHIDGILDSNYLAENIRDHKNSLLKTIGSTERPDVVAARLLEGRIAVVVDGTPVVLTLPYLFSENFQSDEDYYQNHLIASFKRILRYLCFFLAVSVPAVFVAFCTFQLQLLPTSLMLSVFRLREGIPISSFSECLLLIFTFEILKETGMRAPKNLGYALSIVGGLVVGQAAVEAGMVSAPMLIAVSLSAVAGLMLPRLKAAVLFLRLYAVAAAALFGLYGYFAVICLFLIRVLSLRSLGSDATVSLRKPDFQHLKDTFFRTAWTNMKIRPAFNRNRIRKGGDTHQSR